MRLTRTIRTAGASLLPQCRCSALARARGLGTSAISALPAISAQQQQRVEQLATKLVAGQRAALSRAITLVESSNPDHRAMAGTLLDRVTALRGGEARRSAGAEAGAEAAGAPPPPPTFRLGIAGPPGAGKSTFIEALGRYLTTECGHRLAVVAVDPSSTLTGGSILGDKTRMADLSRNPCAYVRPCPSRCALGGVAQHTNEVVLLMEAAGFDIVLVESVGLGQSEVQIDDTVDMLLLLTPPAAGDELQGVKKGIMELADLVVVNKADGDLLPAARHAAVDLKHAMQLLRRREPAWRPRVRTCSALQNEKIDSVWGVVRTYREKMAGNGALQAKRRRQSLRWAWGELQAALAERARASGGVRRAFDAEAERLGCGHVTPRRAAHIALRAMMRGE
eukprot:g4439.t1